MIKRRVPIVSFLLSVVLPGLGHVYNGAPSKGVLFYFGMPVMMTALGLAGLAYFFSGLIALIVAAHSYVLLVAVLAAWAARSKIDYQMKWYNKWYLYVGMFLIAHAALDPVILWTAQFHILGIRSFSTPSTSMEPALKPGDNFLVKLRKYELKPPARGDIVVFRLDVDENTSHAMRVIGLPGETVEIRDKAVFINDKKLIDDWGIHRDKKMLSAEMSARDNFGPMTLGEDRIFVLGDNRDRSYDSRFAGPVNLKDIEGKALFIYFSGDSDRIGTEIK